MEGSLARDLLLPPTLLLPTPSIVRAAATMDTGRWDRMEGFSSWAEGRGDGQLLPLGESNNASREGVELRGGVPPGGVPYPPCPPLPSSHSPPAAIIAWLAAWEKVVAPCGAAGVTSELLPCADEGGVISAVAAFGVSGASAKDTPPPLKLTPRFIFLEEEDFIALRGVEAPEPGRSP